MSLVTKIDIIIKGNNSEGFRTCKHYESIYGIDSFDVTCRYDTIEKLDGFLIENAKDFLGAPIVIKLKVKVGR